jgi:hypothetical protein
MLGSERSKLMQPIRRALGLLVLAAVLILMAAPAFAHSGLSDPVAPNITGSTGMTFSDDLIAMGILQSHEEDRAQ